MSRLADKLIETLTGELPAPLGSFADQLGELVTRYGSERKLATAAGIDRKTLYRWRHPTERTRGPLPKTRGRIEQATRQARLQPGGTDPGAFTVKVQDQGPNTYRHRDPRTLSARQLGLSPGTLDRAAAAYVTTGDPEAVVAAFIAGVTVPFYKRWLTPPPAERGDSVAATPTGNVGAGAPSGGQRRSDDEGDEETGDEFGEEEEEFEPDAYDEYFDQEYEDSGIADDYFGLVVG